MYRAAATGAGLTTLVLLAAIGLFLVLRAWPAFQIMDWRFFSTTEWRPEGAHPHFGILAIMYWTVIIAGIGLLIAVPVSIACALYINEYAPRRARRTLTALVDLLAAIPSVIYGIWGLAFFQPQFVQVSKWLTSNLGFVPFFKTTNTRFAGSAIIVGLVLSLMVQPVCTSVMREVFSQTPPSEKEAALALGASRWGMVRTVILPFGRGGMIGGAMLGMGRALGETIAVALLVSPSTVINFLLLQSGSTSVASHIALRFGDASPKVGLPALMAAGLSLFMLTLVVNFLASIVVSRSRSGKGVEI